MALLILALPGIVQAKVIGLITVDEEHLYEYDYDALLDSYVDKLLGGKSILYDAHIKHPVTIVLDDTNGYVDYDSVLDHYVDALLVGKQFDIHAFTSGDQAVLAEVYKVRVVTVKDGKLVFTEKVIGDPVEIALAAVNAADGAAVLRLAMEKHASALELNLDKYSELSDYGKTLAAGNILQRRDSGFADIQTLGTVFDEEVQQLTDDPLFVVFHQANSVSNASALGLVLEENAQMLELDLSQYNDLGSGSKAAVVQAVFARRGEGFADVQALKDIFAEELADFLVWIDDIITHVNATESPLELEAIIAEHGKAMNLKMDAFSLLIKSRQLTILGDIHADIPYASLETLVEAFNDAVGTMLTSYSVITFSHYDRTLKQMVDRQMQVNPQWDGTGQGWVNAPRDQVEYYVDPTNFVPQELAETVLEVVVAKKLNMRVQPSTTSDILLTLSKGETFTVEEAQKGLEGTQPGTAGYWFKITKDDTSGWVCGKYTDWVFELAPDWLEDANSRWMLQFLVLSGPSGVMENDLADILRDKGILDGTEAAFYQACQEHGINEIFLTSLALHETGNGTSPLAQGIRFDPEDGRPPMKVYNMFGIGAKDSNPNHLGAQYAYNQGWVTPELAIIGGAKFAGESYINHATYGQDTPYKMRWNPQNPGYHQYATDIGWAYKQTKNYRNLYLSMDMYHLKFDIPIYD